MEYFENFNNIYYTFDPNRQEFFTLKNIFTRVNVIGSILQNSLIYYKYQMKDSDTLDIIAGKLYGDPKRHWIIILANVIIDPYFDLPLKPDDFQNNIVLKYGSVSNAMSQIGQYTQTTTVTTTYAGVANTMTYTTTITPEPISYDFLNNAITSRALPTIGVPLTVSDTSVLTPDGSLVETTVVLSVESAYDLETSINESKREILLIDKQYVSQIEKEFQTLLQQ